MILKIFSPKYTSLAFLVLQATLVAVCIRYSRISGGSMYAASTAVLLTEVVKLVVCPIILFYETDFNWKRYCEVFAKDLTFFEILKLSVPSLIYTVQNNLLYFALSRLEAATFQVCYQTKLMTTAIFSVLFLNKKLSMLQWASLVVLAVGVALAQISPDSSSGAGKENSLDEKILGFGSVLAAAVLSGFAGVYFEKILKGSDTSLWMRNIQLSCTSVILAVGGVYFSGEYESSVKDNGLFFGYNSLVVCVVLLQALGGLLVALVVKYADNILKGFAASFSIVTSCFLSLVIFPDFSFNRYLVSGIVLVTLAMYMYSYAPPVASSGTPLPIHNKSISTSSSSNNIPMIINDSSTPTRRLEREY